MATESEAVRRDGDLVPKSMATLRPADRPLKEQCESRYAIHRAAELPPLLIMICLGR